MTDFKEGIYDQITDFLADKMPENERIDFEKELTENELLKAEVEKVRLVKKMAERNALREKIKAIQAEKLVEWAEEEKVKPRNPFFKIIGLSGIAASIALLFFLNFTAFTLPNEAELSLRGSGTELSQLQKENFDNYFKGQDALRKGKNEEAIIYLQKVIESPTIRKYYKDAALWYIAVANVDKYPAETERIIAKITNDKDFRFKISLVDKLKIKWTTFKNKHF
jgi:hypothetical protein